MKAAKIERGELRGIPALRLEAGGYAAAVCPDMGANCLLLERGDASFLRTPPSYAVFRENPNVYGMPLLFPPNRVRGGAFSFQGRRYGLPVNEADRGNHIHGFLSSTPFASFDETIEGDACRVSFSYEATEGSPYSTFPHAFRVVLTYSLGGKGLGQRLEIENRSASDMPVGLGFHTALNCPFISRTEAKDYLLRLSASEEIPLDPAAFVPSGQGMRETAFLEALGGEGIPPQGEALSRHLRGRSLGRNASRAILSHVPGGRALVYRVDPQYAFWTLWNGGGEGGFVCPEPQTWIIDAPNSALSPAESGFLVLAPGRRMTLESVLGERKVAQRRP